MANGLVKYETDTGEVKLSPGIIRKYLVNGQGNVSDQEITMFMGLCRYQHLNPFLREAYLIKYSNNSPATMVTGKDVFTKRAAKHKDFDGAESGVYVQVGNALEKRVGTMVLGGESLVGAWAIVHRKNWEIVLETSVSLSEYIGKKKDGSITKQWSEKPATMIRKVALVQAMREAFPEDFQGLYDASEMPVDGELKTEPVEQEEEIVETVDAEIVEEEVSGGSTQRGIYEAELIDWANGDLISPDEGKILHKKLNSNFNDEALKALHRETRKKVIERQKVLEKDPPPVDEDAVSVDNEAVGIFSEGQDG